MSRWLGHKSIEVTHQIYGHLVPISFDRARTALDAAYQKSLKKQGPRKRAWIQGESASPERPEAVDASAASQVGGPQLSTISRPLGSESG